MMMMMRSLMKGSVDQFVRSSLITKTVLRGSVVQLIVMLTLAIRTALRGSVVQLTVRRMGTTQNARGEGATLALRMKVMPAVGSVAKLVKTVRKTLILLNVPNAK